MATVDACTTAPFTYIWIIENVSEITHIDFQSPRFVVHTISKAEWSLNVAEYSNIYCSLRLENGPDEEFRLIDVEFSFLDIDGSPLISNRDDGYSLFMLTRADFLERLTEFIPNNTLTVRCRMWRRFKYEIPTVDICNARTRLETYTGSFLWPVEEFSALNSGPTKDFSKLDLHERRIYTLKPFTQKEPFMVWMLYLIRNSGSDDVYVDILIEKGRNYVFSSEISVLDVNGKAAESQLEWGKYIPGTILNFWPLISKNKLIASKNLFLANDTLLLRCSFEICTGIISSEIEYCTPNVSSIIKEVTDSSPLENDADDSLQFEELFMKKVNDYDSDDSIEEKSDSNSCNKSCSLRAALRYLYSESTMSDVSLRIGTKLHLVHKNILCSRSPVFEKIFSNDIKNNVIEIHNMDESKLRDLLQYIYTDTVGNFQFEKALDLYEAAVDYQLLDLKDKCSDFLVMNLSKNNLREILSLARKYQDEKLETAGKDFASGSGKKLEITKNSKRLADCNLM